MSLESANFYSSRHPLSFSSTGNAGVRQTDASRTTAQTQEAFLTPQEYLVTIKASNQ